LDCKKRVESPKVEQCRLFGLFDLQLFNFLLIQNPKYPKYPK
jgi:hypothetical protein